MRRDRFDALMYVLHSCPKMYCHASMVAFYIKDDYTAVVGALHDIVEDGVATFNQLQKKFNLDENQMTALRLLTRNKGKQYFKYIEEIKGNSLATAVKLADLKDNIQRCARDLPKNFSLLKRYVRAYEILS